VLRRDVDVRFEVTSVRRPDGIEAPAESLRGARVVLLLGVARPARVVETARGLGAEVVEVLAHADHHRFTPEEVRQAVAAAERAGALLVTTEKDAERLEPGVAHVLLLEARRLS
jgi:tetraacyldisaccharide 4'-kinase